MIGRIGVLLVLATAACVAAEPQQDVMLHVYPKGGVFHYAPGQVEVLPNATVVLGHLFGNHSLTSVDGLFNDTGNSSHWPTIRAPSTPGTYRFYCWLHATPGTSPEAGMAGDLIVGVPQSSGSTDGPVDPLGESRRSDALPTVALLAGLATALLLLRRR